MQRYYVKRPTGKVFGPFDENAIRLMLKGKKLGSDAQVSTDKESWKPISELDAFDDAPSGGDAPLPRPAGPPDLPIPKGAGADLPAPKRSMPDLPAPKRSMPDLPTPKGEGADLPGLRQQSDLPTSASSLPRSAGANLPRSAGDNLPASGPPDLPRSANANLPGAGNLPSPAGPPDDDDLFGAPIEDEDDLFASPGAGLDEDSDDLFGSGLDEESDDLFASGLDEESDDLFGAPDTALDEESDDLFGAPVSGDSLDDDPLADDDDLFDAPEMEDDDLFSSAPADDDDFLGGDQGFSFLADDDPEDDDLEDWEEEISNDTFSPEDLGGDPHQPSPVPASGPSPAGPARQPDRPGADEHDPFRPASRGIAPQPDASAKTTSEEATAADKKRGITTLIGVSVVGLLLFGAGGFALYQAFLSDDDVVEIVDDDTRQFSISLDDVRSDNYSTLMRIIDDAQSAELDTENQARLLIAKSLLLSRYENDNLDERARSLAERLAPHEGEATVSVALALHQARQGDPEAASALAEGFTSDPELGSLAYLALGLADTTAYFEGDEFLAALEPADSAGLDFDPEQQEDLDEHDEPPANGDESTTEVDADDDAEDHDQEDLAEQEAQREEQVQQQGRADRAAQHFNNAAQADPTFALPHYWLARLAIHTDEIDDALEHLGAAVSANSSHVASRLQSAQLHYQRGNLNDATEHLREIIEVLPDSASSQERAHALHLMGSVHQARQESEQAIEMFTRALSTDSSRRGSLRALAEEYERAQMYEEAYNFFSTDENLGQEDPDVILGMVRSLMGMERWNSAIRQLEEGEELFPDDARFPYNLGVLNEERGTFRPAREAYERALEIDPTILPAHTSLAMLSWRLDNDVTQGERHIASIVEHADLITAPIASDVAEYYRASNRPLLAQRWNEEALRMDPNYWEARLALARIYLDERQTEEALQLLERSREEGVQDLNLSAYLADAYRQSEQFDRALEEINSVIAERPDERDYIFIRGLIYFDRGNYSTARENFANAYDLDPQYHRAYFYVGRTALAQGDNPTAIRIFRHVLDYQPNNAGAHYFMGRTFEKENSITQALDSYRNAVNADPIFVEENPDVLVRRGRLYAQLGRMRLAQADIRRALELSPESPDALLTMAALYFQDGNYTQAIDHYTRVLEEHPEHADAQYELGMSYIYENQDQLGARHLQLAVHHGYEDPEIFRTMGYLYRELGQRNNALESFKRYLRETEEREIADSTRREMLRQIQELGG